MAEDLNRMAQLERDIEKRMEAACEKDGWIVSVAITTPHNATLFIEKFSETPIRSSDEDAALRNAQVFAKSEFGSEAKVVREEAHIPNTRAPFHVQLRLKAEARVK